MCRHPVDDHAPYHAHADMQLSYAMLSTFSSDELQIGGGDACRARLRRASLDGLCRQAKDHLLSPRTKGSAHGAHSQRHPSL